MNDDTRTSAAPEWSGRPVRLVGRFAVAMVHNDDTIAHKWPGWKKLHREPEDMPEYDAEAWFLLDVRFSEVELS